MVRKMAQETLEKFERENKENSFKQTEIGLIPEDWEVVRFEGSILKRRIKVGKIKQQEYKKFGKYPVIDQSQNYIAGFCDDDEKVYRGELPVIIFGDHTRVFKFVNFPFVVGADGVKVLIPNKEIYDPKFLFYAMLTLNIPSRGYNRHYKLLREKELPFPPLSEQRKIVRVLDRIQQAIELQDRIIEQAKNLKKSLMQKLFTEGLYGEEQKEMEIGLIPKSWEVVRLGEVATQRKEQTLPSGGKFKYIGLEHIESGETRINRFDFDQNVKSLKYKFYEGDILYGKLRPYLDKAVKAPFEGICSTDIIVIQADEKKIVSDYLVNLMHLPTFVNYATSTMTGVNHPRTSWKAISNFKIPLSPLEEQKQIAHILNVVDEKIEVEQMRKQVLKELFKTMLHKLMSGEIRLKEVEI